MKARQKCWLAGPTTGCWPKKDNCIEEKQRVRDPAVRSTKKSKQANKNICIHIHTAHIFVCMIVWRSESESASHSSPPQLKGVRVISACVRTCVLTAGVHAHKSGQTKKKILSYTLVKHKSDCFQRKKRNGISMHACICTRVWVCAATTSLIHPLFVCLSVCACASERGGEQSHTQTRTHIMVLTSSVSYFGKRRAAPTWCPYAKDAVHQLAWGRSPCARAAHRCSRRWRCSRQRMLSTLSTGQTGDAFSMLRTFQAGNVGVTSRGRGTCPLLTGPP